MAGQATMEDFQRRYENLKKMYFQALRSRQEFDPETGEPVPAMYDIGIITKQFTDMGLYPPRRPDDPMEFLPQAGGS